LANLIRTLINTLAYVRHFDILCINKLCQIGEDAYVYVNYHIKKQNNHQYEIAELGFEPTASKSQEITGMGTTSDHWGRGWKPTGDERPCFFFETLLPCL
jgi:hypothetical protein